MSDKKTELEAELGRLMFEIGLLEEKRIAVIQQQNPLRQKANEVATQLKAMREENGE